MSTKHELDVIKAEAYGIIGPDDYDRAALADVAVQLAGIERLLDDVASGKVELAEGFNPHARMQFLQNKFTELESKLRR